jgi:hypothetical protein
MELVLHVGVPMMQPPIQPQSTAIRLNRAQTTTTRQVTLSGDIASAATFPDSAEMIGDDPTG